MMLVTKYQIPVINSCFEKCAYMLNVYKNQQTRQTASRTLIGPKTLPTIWGTYMKLLIVAEKNATKNEHIQNVCSMCIKINKVGKQEVEI
jgi:hypothetical protein